MDDLTRAERLVTAAFRGLMEGILGSTEGAVPARSRGRKAPSAPAATADPLSYPQAPDLTIDPTLGPDAAAVREAVEQAMRELDGAPSPHMDLFQVQQAQAAREAELRRLSEIQTQPGPGEDERRGWQHVG